MLCTDNGGDGQIYKPLIQGEALLNNFFPIPFILTYSHGD